MSSAMFQRRDPRSYSRAAREALWPRGGWGRAVTYMKHRLRRLPDPPHVVARGVLVGVFASFTPFYGFHLVIAWFGAKAIGGNPVAGLLGTFFGNPLTYIPIAYASLATGHWILGTSAQMPLSSTDGPRVIFERFAGAWDDLLFNMRAAFTADEAHWGGLRAFWDAIFLPYLVGCFIPGVLAGIACYYLCLPAVAAYQKARRTKLAKKIAALREKAKAKSAPPG